MPSVTNLLRDAEIFLRANGVETAKLDAELLMARALDCKRSAVHLRRFDEISEPVSSNFIGMVRRRGFREPLQYVVGEVEFYGLTLKVRRGVLIPRHETEELVDKIVVRCKNSSVESILDLGTGSGAIGLALAKIFPPAKVLLVDSSEQALEIAKENAIINGVNNAGFLLGNWFENVNGKFSIIAANPPYLAEEEFASAEKEVKFFEPKSALVAENGGLADIFKIIESAGNFLTPGGLLAIETGIDQHFSILSFAEKHFNSIESEKDLLARDRFLFLRKNSRIH
jgi:release factor glutamine methyltransferase